jgi:hypothetical protein
MQLPAPNRPAANVLERRGAARALWGYSGSWPAKGTLKRIVADKKEPSAAQVSAVIALLDRAWGRPAQAIALGISRKSLEEMGVEELLTIAALALMAIRKGPINGH